MTYMRGIHAVRSERWRYIRYFDGSAELYDLRDDPGETTDLSGEVTARARCEAVVQRIAEPVDTGDDIIQPAGLFGRKFAVVSFRWLD